ncbi:undecaprenyldiphospho-muramoylpentapeptide beta-N-acetylglucosaminyltransferase [Trichlorobacter lovleyi]|uniref:undecaprenyldiphospho-muramoylpentapeptide beta-N-acetylglucosaminyltransferase n=1 Tax=Trichlorobacter lovleyi TaxID=313985 RepID=UPI00223FCC72|nr:undecaprenyldiphospho-muramoylpentapeptide beta-N-acetylglucosaminyltransferase [Trichlorobacter lovleyi]QOX77894.1 undecaprenyldiphospho-muramoylpentapeptide beta-N-acetylglucosaminyltransferase [Trichlorobacter lovleyi]
MKLIVAGGGTGGHLFPGIAVAEEFLSRDPANQVLFVGSERGIEARTIPRLGYQLELISAAGIRGKGSLAKLKGAAMMIYGYAQSRKILHRFQPDLVLGVGGYASLPMVMAARGMEIPRYIHEQNALPGMSNKVLSRVANKVFISLEESAKFFPRECTLLTGNPLRRQILEMLSKNGQEKQRSEAFQLFVFGGSQGAHALNVALPQVVAQLSQEQQRRLKIIHQTGEADLLQVRSDYQANGLEADVRPFIDDMAAAYRQADLIICRAGATTIAEVTALGKACLFVPFPHATDDHQRKNAEALLKQGACEMLLEQEIGGKGLSDAIARLMENRDALKLIGENAAALARLDAARVIVDQMLEGVQPCTET